MVNGSGYGTRCGGIPFPMKALFRLVRGWPQTHPSCYDTTETHFTSNPEKGFQRFRLIYTSDIYFNRSSYFDKFYELSAKNTLKRSRKYFCGKPVCRYCLSKLLKIFWVVSLLCGHREKLSSKFSILVRGRFCVRLKSPPYI